jgi:hypothetical protein
MTLNRIGKVVGEAEEEEGDEPSSPLPSFESINRGYTGI